MVSKKKVVKPRRKRQTTPKKLKIIISLYAKDKKRYHMFYKRHKKFKYFQLRKLFEDR